MNGRLNIGGGCSGCAAKDRVIAELTAALRAVAGVPASAVRSPELSFYDHCPCNPSNGGSGICGCVRDSQTIC